MYGRAIRAIWFAIYTKQPAGGSGKLDLSGILPAGVQLPESYLILYEQGISGLAQLDPANWSDIVQFWPTAVQLFSDPLAPVLVDEVFTSAVKIAMAEETGPTTEYTAGGALFRIYGDIAETPEPASIVLFGLVLVAVGGAHKLRAARR